jgi:preprotein translocase subunit SecA
MEYLREGIGLRGYGQIDPLVAYKQESSKVFAETLHAIRNDVVMFLFHAQVAPPQPRQVVRIAGDANPAVAGARGGMGIQKLTDDAEPLAQASAPPTGKVGAQRPVPVRERQEIQKVLLPEVWLTLAHAAA